MSSRSAFHELRDGVREFLSYHGYALALAAFEEEDTCGRNGDVAAGSDVVLHQVRKPS
jgi:hypothetical protein